MENVKKAEASLQFVLVAYQHFISEMKKVIEFSSLNHKSKEAFYKFLITKNIQFVFDRNEGMYIATIVKPAQKQPTSNQQQAKTISRSPSRIPVPEVVASVFPTFCSLLGSLTSSAQSKLKPPALIMKLIDNIYDARLRYEQQNEIMKQKLRTYPQKHLEQDHFHGDDKLDPFTSFPAFVYHHFKQLHGVNSIVTQNCWDLMCNIISLRKSVNTPLSIEIFAQFLSEQRSIDHLAFFVRTREAVLN
ncbi:hypothetical protein ADUPG1_000618, partial [Aduncisulcus paluster]